MSDDIANAIQDVDLNDGFKFDNLSLIQKGRFQSRPLTERERTLFLIGLYTLKPHVIERILRSIAYGDITQLLYDEMAYAYQDQSNSLISVFAYMGAGKSELAKSIAIFQKNFARELLKTPENRIFLCWSFSQTMEALRAAKTGDVILQDETKAMSGEGSATMLKRLANILMNFRKKQISVIVVCPVKTDIRGICNFYLKIDGKYREERETKVLVYSGESGRLLGFAEISLRNDPDLDQYYLEKDDNIERILENGGYDVVQYEAKFIEKHTTEVLNEMYRLFADIPFSFWRVSIIDSIIRKIGIAGDSSYRKIIEDEVKTIITIQKAKEEAETSFNKSDLTISIGTNKSRYRKFNEKINRQPIQIEFDKYLRDFTLNFLIKYKEKFNFSDLNLLNRFTEYYFSNMRRSFTELAEFIGELRPSDLSIQREKREDSIRKYVMEINNKLTRTDKGKLFEQCLESYLEEKLKHLLNTEEAKDAGLSIRREGGLNKCDLHLTQIKNRKVSHLLCINAKLKMDFKGSYSDHCLPEFENNPKRSYLVLWSCFTGLVVFRGQQEKIISSNAENIGIQGLLHILEFTIEQFLEQTAKLS